MNKYRIIYWLGSMTTETYVRATNKENAIENFTKNKGSHKIISVDEVTI